MIGCCGAETVGVGDKGGGTDPIKVRPASLVEHPTSTDIIKVTIAKKPGTLR